MAVHDEQWDMPYPRFGPTSSYNAPVVPPSVDPDGGTLVQVPCLSLEWIPFVLGALDQLRLPSTWKVADDDALLLVLQRVANLRDLIASWGACEVLAFRCNPVSGVQEYSVDDGAAWTALPACFAQTQLRFDAASCQLQYSADRGATWLEVSGWDAIGACIEAAGGTTGAGPFAPTSPPPNPFSQSAGTRACNVAGYLSTQVIQKAVTQAVSSYNVTASFLSFLTSFETLLAAAVGVGVVTGLVLDACVALYSAYTAGTIADFTAAESDAALWGNVTCAIYNAIKADGYVTPGNFGAVLAGLAAVSYAHAEVVSAVHDFVAALGYPGLHALQVPGALAVIDCSGCGTWCHYFDFSLSDGGWTPNAAAGGGGVYVAGVGWRATQGGANGNIQIGRLIPGGSAPYLTRFDWNITAGAGNAIQLKTYLAADLSLAGNQSVTPGAIAGHPTWGRATGWAHPTWTAVALSIANNGWAGVGSAWVLTGVQLAGDGPNPFGPDNCLF